MEPGIGHLLLALDKQTILLKQLAARKADPGLAELAAKYDCRVTTFEALTNAWTLIAKADPNRWYIHIIPFQGPVVGIAITPGPPYTRTFPVAIEENPTPAKYRDCPATVTGEWYVMTAVGQEFTVIEELYLE